MCHIKKAFTTYIRSLLEYISLIYGIRLGFISPIYYLLDSVQLEALPSVLKQYLLPYIEYIGIFDLEPLEVRRLRHDLVQCYKILNNLTPLNPADHFILHFPLTSARDLLPIIVTNQVLSGCFFYRHIDTLIAGTVCHPLCVILNYCQL